MYKGQPLERHDAPLKVRGAARYSAENFPAGLVHAYAISSTIPAPRVLSFDLSQAKGVPGVLLVLTHENAAKVPKPNPKGSRQKQPIQALQDDRIHKFGQFLGLVVATTWENAREAARLVKVSYAPETPRLDFESERANASKPKQMLGEADTTVGDFASAFAACLVKVDAVYETPTEHHHPMEPHVIIVGWEGQKLECWASSQGSFNNVGALAATFQLPDRDVRVQSLYVGGGFGSKGASWEHMAMAAMAARMVGRPVKLVLTRQQLAYMVGLRQQNRQHVQLGATTEGKLQALAHHTQSWHATSNEFVEPAGAISRMLYEHKHGHVTHRACQLNLPTPWFTRAPGETPGSFALESAIDELAHQLKLDPVEFRLNHEAPDNPTDGTPWSSRSLAECLRVGAKQFGWKPEPHREGDWLIGYGMAGAARGAPMRPCKARIRVKRSQGTVNAIVELAANDIGTGSYTIILQAAADGLGLPPNQIKVRIGDSAYPEAPASTGSVGAASFCPAVDAAAKKLRAELSKLSGLPADRPLAQLLGKRAEFQAEAGIVPPEQREQYSLYGFAAHFVEVGVDPELGLVRVRRLHSAASAGTIINPRLARSQMLGGIVWGIGQALTEHSPHDTRYGNFIARDLVHYHLPVNPDVGRLSVEFIPEIEPIANGMGIKGIGELGIVGVAAAIANGVFDATGRRIRRLPIRPVDFMG